MNSLSRFESSSMVVEGRSIREGISIVKCWKERVGAVDTTALSFLEQDSIRRYKSVLSYALMELNTKSPKPTLAVYVAIDDFGIQGVLIWKIAKNSLMIEELATAPHNFHPVFFEDEKVSLKGVGRALLAYAKIEAENRGLDSLKLRYFEGSQEFYRKAGMTQTEQGFSLDIN